MLEKISRLPTPHKLVAAAILGAGGGVLIYVSRESWLRIVGVVLVAIVGVGCLLALLRLWVGTRERKRSEQLHKALTSRQVGDSLDEQDRQKLEELREQWQRAVTQLKSAALDPYSLPWYLLIGEPQSGKSTTLRNSGLEFPVGTDALSGPEGTRNCDFWFTNQAVILDTAGRYTFQEWDRPYSREFEEFLKLLRRHRARCPINGVIVTIPSTALLGDDTTTRETKAKNIRDKLKAIENILEVQFPVYLLITKCDLMLGFAEFFSKLPALEQRQLFGWSKPHPFEEPFELEEFDKVYEDLNANLARWRLKLIAEGAGSDLDRLFAFPDEFAALKQPLREYLAFMLGENRFMDPLFFRGFFFTSGVQKGRPILLACANLIKTSAGGPDEKDLAEIFERSSAFFIRDFYKKKVFRETGLISPTRKFVKRRRQIEYGAYIGAGALGLALVLLLIAWIIDLPAPFRAPASSLAAADEILTRNAPAVDPDALERSVNAATDLMVSTEQILSHGISAGVLPWHKLWQGRDAMVRELGAAFANLFVREILYPVAKCAEQQLNTENYPGTFEVYLAAAEDYLALDARVSLASLTADQDPYDARNEWRDIDGLLELIARSESVDRTFDAIRRKRDAIQKQYAFMIKLHDELEVRPHLSDAIDRNRDTILARVEENIAKHWQQVIDNTLDLKALGEAERQSLEWRKLAAWDQQLSRLFDETLALQPGNPRNLAAARPFIDAVKRIVGPRDARGEDCIRGARWQIAEVLKNPVRQIPVTLSLGSQLVGLDRCFGRLELLSSVNRRPRLNADHGAKKQALEAACKQAADALMTSSFLLKVEEKEEKPAGNANSQPRTVYVITKRAPVDASLAAIEALATTLERFDNQWQLASEDPTESADAYKSFLGRLNTVEEATSLDPITADGKRWDAQQTGEKKAPFEPATFYHNAARLVDWAKNAHTVLRGFALAEILETYRSHLDVPTIARAFTLNVDRNVNVLGKADFARSFLSNSRDAILKHLQDVKSFAKTHSAAVFDEQVRSELERTIVAVREQYASDLSQAWEGYYRSFSFDLKAPAQPTTLEVFSKWLATDADLLRGESSMSAVVRGMAALIRGQCDYSKADSSLDDDAKSLLQKSLKPFRPLIDLDQAYVNTLADTFSQLQRDIDGLVGKDDDQILASILASRDKKADGTPDKVVGQRDSKLAFFHRSAALPAESHNEYFMKELASLEQKAQAIVMADLYHGFEERWTNLGKHKANLEGKFPFDGGTDADVLANELRTFLVEFDSIVTRYGPLLPGSQQSRSLLPLKGRQPEFISATKALYDFLFDDKEARVNFTLEWKPKELKPDSKKPMLATFSFFSFTVKSHSSKRLSKEASESPVFTWDWLSDANQVSFEILDGEMRSLPDDKGRFQVPAGPLALLRFVRKYRHSIEGGQVVIEHGTVTDGYLRYRLMFKATAGDTSVANPYPAELPSLADAGW